MRDTAVMTTTEETRKFSFTPLDAATRIYESHLLIVLCVATRHINESKFWCFISHVSVLFAVLVVGQDRASLEKAV